MSKPQVVPFVTVTATALVAAFLAAWVSPLKVAAQTMPDSPGITVDPGGVLMHRAPVFYQGAATGSVTLEATLNGKGEVSDVRVLGGPDELRKPSLQSVLQWHYSTDAGVSSPVHVTIKFASPPAGDSVRRIVAPRALPAPQTPPTVTRIEFAGVPAEVEKKLRASLPLREGDTLTPETLRRVREMAQAIDEHFLVLTFNTGEKEAAVRFTLGFVGGPAGGIPGGVIGGVASGIPAAAPPPPPPPPRVQPPAQNPQRIRVGGNVQAANLISTVTPEYPPLAREARIQGVVRFTAIVGKDGTVQNLQLISGHPLLVPAATQAARQWVYKPTLLNGQPVEVITQVEVNFTLAP